MNSRFYTGYMPEDFIGRMSTVCAAGNNVNMEYVGLSRFYLGQLDNELALYVFFCLATLDLRK